MILAALLLGGTVLVSGTGATQADFNFKIAVPRDGIYRVTYDELGHEGVAPDSSMLALYERGIEVPIQVNDEGDGRFGEGDSITFIGRRLQGDHSWFSEHSGNNIYRLTLKEDSGRRRETVV